MFRRRLGSCIAGLANVASRAHTAPRPTRLRPTTYPRLSSSFAKLRDPPPNTPAVDEQPGLLEDIPQSSLSDGKIAIRWSSTENSRFHNFWLRDHCRCPECFHPITKQRLLDTFSIPATIYPTSVESKVDGLYVTWPTGTVGHVSVYPWHWLRTGSYDPPIDLSLIDNATDPLQSEKILWGSRIEQSPPTVAYNDVMKDEKAVLRWLRKIDQFGFCFVEGVPATPEDTEALIRRIAFIRETQYGGFWDFTADLRHGDTAYTNLALGAHTDTTYYTDPCGLQIFHLLSHTEGTGGSSLLVDGFYAASVLKALDPAAHATLASVRIPTHSAGEPGNKFIMNPGEPILNINGMDEVVGVRYNNDDRSVLKEKPEVVEQWYDALRKWNKCLTSADSEYWVQLAPGTVVVIDNQRILHGRAAFTGKRRMCGAYIGKDDFKSRLRVLEEGSGVRSVWDAAL